MTRYTPDSKDRVRDAVDMVALVGARTELRRAGVNSYFGICPFHDERTGSFHVSPDDKLYHCFGCQASGDPFNFVMETEGLDFTGALEALADRFGVQLETTDDDPEATTRRRRRDRLHNLLGRAAAYYARYLWDAKESAGAREYLLARGLTEETLRDFRVGYAPSAWDRILTASRRAGFKDEELLAAGLVQRSKTRPGQVYDRFRERIMFPSADARGRVVGFGARAMRENQRPKYLNTSDSELYHKRRQLFGIDLARAPATRAGRMILVEGYTDVIALHQAGLQNAVGIMGTALTEEQVAELERVSQVLELCLDADRAGQEAMLRAARLAAGRKLELRVVPLPEGTDPAELIERQGADALRDRVTASAPFIVFHVERILERSDTRSAEGRAKAFAELQPVLRDLPRDELGQDLLRRVASRLELTYERVSALLAETGERSSTAGRGPAQVDASAPIRVIDQAVRAERTFLALCVALPDLGAETLRQIDPDELLTSEPLRRAARQLQPRTRTPLSDLPHDDEELARVIADLVDRAGRAGTVSAEHLQYQLLVLQVARLDRAIRRARASGRTTGELAAERKSVQEAMQRVQLERAV